MSCLKTDYFSGFDGMGLSVCARMIGCDDSSADALCQRKHLRAKEELRHAKVFFMRRMEDEAMAVALRMN
jgi:hypothetical protein